MWFQRRSEKVEVLQKVPLFQNLSKRALGSSESERARRARALDRALCRVLADLRRRKAELGHLPRSGLLSEARLVLEAGLTMALRGVLFMQTGRQHHDDRSITFGAEQNREGVIYLRQGAHAMVQLTD